MCSSVKICGLCQLGFSECVITQHPSFKYQEQWRRIMFTSTGLYGVAYAMRLGIGRGLKIIIFNIASVLSSRVCEAIRDIYIYIFFNWVIHHCGCLYSSCRIWNQFYCLRFEDISVRDNYTFLMILSSVNISLTADIQYMFLYTSLLV